MMGTPVPRIAVLLLSCLLLTMPRADAEDNAAPEDLRAAIGASLPPDWTKTFVAAVTEGLAHSSVPPRILATVWKSIPPDWIPEDPQAAAGRFLAAAGEADRALRRGIPSTQVRAEIRGIWRTLSQDAPSLISRQHRGGKSVQDLENGIKRRSDSGILSIGSGGAAGQGAGPGDEGAGSGTGGSNAGGSGGGGGDAE